jgi:hypothetical protein
MVLYTVPLEGYAIHFYYFISRLATIYETVSDYKYCLIFNGIVISFLPIYRGCSRL